MTPRATNLVRYAAVCLLLGSGVAPAFGQTTYYVASSGNDSNSGRSADAPFQTINKINGTVLQPGDQVLFKRSDTFRGTLQIRQSGTSEQPIIIDGYGSGNKPRLAGSVPVGNWNSLGNNIWEAGCATCGSQVTGLYRDNTALPLGRYPNPDAANKGYLTVQSHAGKTQLTSQQALPTNWTGGEAVFRPVQWILNRAAIVGQNGNTLTLAGAGTYDIADNWGYFIQNHPATLDQNGEWYYDPAKKTIRLFDNQNNPNTQAMAATAHNEALTLTNVSFVTVRNLALTQALTTNLLVTDGSNLVISDNEISQAGEDGVLIRGGGSRVLLENNVIEAINNNGVAISAYQAITFRGNTVRRIGLTAGRGRSGDGTYVGFMSASTGNTLIENNVFDQIGYNALDFASSTTIQRNRVSNFCLTKSDGSGLYIWNGNQQPMNDIRILSNVVYNGIGAPEGTPGGAYSGANGIYLDDCTTNIEVANNSVYDCRGLGIFLHGSSNIRLTGNTAFNNGEGQLAVTTAGGCQPRNNTIQNNIFVSKQATQFNVKYESAQNDLGSFGQIDNNVYARPFDDTYTIRAVYNGNIGADLSLADWRSRYGKDGSTIASPVTYSSGSPDDKLRFVGNPTGNPIQVPLSGTFRDARNNVYTEQVTVAAFSSIVLFSDKNVEPVSLRNPENPADAVAGLTYDYYEGNWGTLPNFGALTALKSGSNTMPELAIRSRDNDYGVRFSGYVTVPTDGVYTFYTSSDDGSKLFIGSTEVVNNDGGHAEQERSGTIGLKAGTHAISIPYFQGGGGQMLTVSYSGPGIGKQIIPASAYRRSTSASPSTGTASLRTPENPANTGPGLVYDYYEGNWGTLPNFGALTALKSGVTLLPELAVRSRDNDYGVRFSGYVTVPTDGVYTFYTSSDDGSKLFIGSTEVVNNDGVHGEQERSGTIGLKAGTHAISIPFFQGVYGQMLTVSYSGPGIGKQIIPASAYRQTGVAVAANGSGLRADYFNNNTLTAPAVLTRTDATVNFDWGVGSPAPGINPDYFSVRWTGQVKAPATGTYTFSTTTDDGVRLWVDGKLMVDDWNAYAVKTNTGPTISLVSGQRYDIRMEYFDNAISAVARLQWTYAGHDQEVIPQTYLYPAGGSARVAASLPIDGAASEFDPGAVVEVYPVPAREAIQVRYVAKTAGELIVQLTSVGAYPVMQKSTTVVPGENIIRIPVLDYNRGFYILSLVQGTERITKRVLLAD